VVLKGRETRFDALQTVSCVGRITPKEDTEAALAHARRRWSVPDPIIGPLIVLDDLGDAIKKEVFQI
jgi:hypothetical protein